MIKAEIKNCLVTGGSGLLGTNLVKGLLEKGCTVTVYDLAPFPFQHDRVKYVKGNICDLEQLTAECEGMDTVFHAAAFISILGGTACTQEYRDRAFAINVDGTKNVLKACTANGVKRLVYTSSNNVCFKRKPMANSYETEPYCTDYIDLYTETKAIIEPIVLEASGKQGLLTCALRPSGIYGPGDQLVLKEVVKNLVAGTLKIIIGDGTAKADNTYVDNLVHAEILAAEHLVEDSPVPGEAYYINDNDPKNYFEFFNPIIDGLGYKQPKIKIPSWLLYPFIFLAEQFYFRIGQKLGMPEPPARIGIIKVVTDNYFSTEKAKRDMGYEPVVSPEEAMRRSVQYCVQLHDELQGNAVMNDDVKPMEV